jgi:DNA processing protein
MPKSSSGNDTYQTSTVMALRESGAVGPKMFQAILHIFGSPENVFNAAVDELTELPRVSQEKAVQILSSQDMIPLMSERLERLEEEDIRIVTFLDEHYPPKLRSIDGPPPVLYYRGTLPDPDQKSIAIVGTTAASSQGIAAAVEISGVVVRKGFSVISGLARGIDSAAHIGAIKNNGTTHAVIGSGFYNIYPEENQQLAEQISEKGMLMSEYPPDTNVNTGRLIARNRIVVGLCDTAVVVELSPDSSGSLSAAEACDNQGKLLFYLMGGKEEEKGISVPHNAIPFETLDDVETILQNSIGS